MEYALLSIEVISLNSIEYLKNRNFLIGLTGDQTFVSHKEVS